MRRATVSKCKPAAGNTVMVYVAGVKGKVALSVPVKTPAQIRRSLRLSPTSKRRIARVMAEAGFGSKVG